MGRSRRLLGDPADEVASDQSKRIVESGPQTIPAVLGDRAFGSENSSIERDHSVTICDSANQKTAEVSHLLWHVFDSCISDKLFQLPHEGRPCVRRATRSLPVDVVSRTYVATVSRTSLSARRR